MDHLRAALLDWVACSNQPVSEVENPWFRRVLAVLHHDVLQVSIEMMRFNILHEVARVEGEIFGALEGEFKQSEIAFFLDIPAELSCRPTASNSLS